MLLVYYYLGKLKRAPQFRGRNFGALICGCRTFPLREGDGIILLIDIEARSTFVEVEVDGFVAGLDGQRNPSLVAAILQQHLNRLLDTAQVAERLLGATGRDDLLGPEQEKLNRS